MNILLSSFTNCKFFQDISLYEIDNINIYHINIKDNVYNLYYKLHPKYLFINVFEINHETVQFADEFKHECVVYCYVPFLQYNTYNNIPNIPHFRYLTRNNIDSLNNQKIIPNNLVNTKYLDSIDKTKTNQAVCFLDGITQKEHKTKLLDILYPNKQDIKIKLFNDKSFLHPQNLGYIDYSEKIDMLSKSKYFLMEEGSDYYYDALYLKCMILNIENISTNNIPKESKSINNIIYDYHDYLKEIILQ